MFSQVVEMLVKALQACEEKPPTPCSERSGLYLGVHAWLIFADALRIRDCADQVHANYFVREVLDRLLNFAP